MPEDDNSVDLLRAVHHVINNEHARSDVNYEELINKIVSDSNPSGSEDTENVSKEIKGIMENLKMDDVDIQLTSEKKPNMNKATATALAGYGGGGLQSYLQQNNDAGDGFQSGYRAGDDDTEDYGGEHRYNDDHLQRLTEEKKKYNDIQNIVMSMEGSKGSARQSAAQYAPAQSQRPNFAAAGHDADQGGMAPAGYGGGTSRNGGYVRELEEKGERSEFIETIIECRKCLKESGSSELDDLPSLEEIRDQDLETLRGYARSYREARARQQYTFFTNEAVTFVAKSVESVFNGKRKFFGKRLDAQGWYLSGASIKIRRLQSQMATTIGRFFENSNIGLGLATVIELTFNLFSYMSDKSQQYDEPDMFEGENYPMTRGAYRANEPPEYYYDRYGNQFRPKPPSAPPGMGPHVGTARRGSDSFRPSTLPADDIRSSLAQIRNYGQ